MAAAQGWSFLVARGRREGYRTVLAPDFLADAGFSGMLNASLGSGPRGAGPGAVAVVNLSAEPVGGFAVAYVAESMTCAVVDGGAAAVGAEPLRDEHGRPLEALHGFVTRHELAGPPDDLDLELARREAIESFRAFLADEDGTEPDRSHAFALRTATRPRSDAPNRRLSPRASTAPSPSPGRGRAGRRRPSRRWLAGVCIALAMVAAGVALVLWSPGGPPMTATVSAAPQSLAGTDQRRHLVYELVVQNAGESSVRLDRVDVRDAARGTVLARYRGANVAALTTAGGGVVPTLGAGRSTVLLLDVRLRPGTASPQRLEHDLAGTITTGDARRITTTSGRTPVQRGTAPRLALPLGGAELTVTGGLHGATSSAPSAPKEARAAQRYAVDLRRLVAGGTNTLEGDRDRNESYAVFADPVLASASGRVVAARDGVRDNTPPRALATIAPDAAVGNFVLQDLGHGRFAVYAHLKRESLRVRVGEMLRRGQTLGRVGNSGDSAQPHLQLRLINGPGGTSTLAAQGLPFTFDRFDLEARIRRSGDDAMRVPAAKPQRRTGEHPLAGDVMAALTGT